MKLGQRGIYFTKRVSMKVAIQRHGLNPETLGSEKLIRASVCTGQGLVLNGCGRTVNLKPGSGKDESTIRIGAINSVCESADLVVQPDFVAERVSDGKKVGDILQLEFNDVVSTTLYGCTLKNRNVGCKFCRSKPYQGNNFSIAEFRAALEVVKRFQKPFLVINAGTIMDGFAGEPGSRLLGYAETAPYVREARSAGISSICLELCPPKSAEDTRELIARMKDDGATAAQFNIEMYDQEARLKYMPFKGTIPAESYLMAIEEGAKTFGPGKVSSVLLLGFEGKEDVVRGANAILAVGGIPSIESFRMVPGIEITRAPVEFSVEQVVGIVSEVTEMIVRKFGREVSEIAEGCMRCRGCPLVFDMI